MTLSNGQVVSWYVCTSIAVATLCIRLLTRWNKAFPWGLDDVLLILAALCLVGDLVIQQYMFDLGMVNIGVVSRENYIAILKMIIPGSILYITSLWAIKTSLVIFYKRLASRTSTQTVYNITLIWLLATYLLLVLDDVFQCWPVERKWTEDTNLTCSSKQSSINYWLTVILNISTDILIMSLPISMVLKLQLPLAQRLGVAAIFGLGFLVVIASIIRALYAYSNQTMLTCTVSMIETAVAIIATCLPVLRSFFFTPNQPTKSTSLAHHELSSYRINQTLRNNTYICSTTSSSSGGRKGKSPSTTTATSSVTKAKKSSESEDDLVKETWITDEEVALDGAGVSSEYAVGTLGRAGRKQTSLASQSMRSEILADDDGSFRGNVVGGIMVCRVVRVEREYGRLDDGRGSGKVEIGVGNSVGVDGTGIMGQRGMVRGGGFYPGRAL